MATWRICIYDPETRRNRLFWVSVLDEMVEAETEELAILNALHHFCQEGGISLLQHGRMHITANKMGDFGKPIVIRQGAHA